MSSNRTPEIAVILVNFRGADAIRANLGKLVEFLRGHDVEYVMIDNSPGDGAAEEYCRILPEGRVVSSCGNVGFAAAVNRGLAETSGPVILLYNPDIEGVDGSLEGVMDLFAEDPGVAAVGVAFANSDGSVQPSCRLRPTPPRILAEWFALHKRFPRAAAFSEYRLLDWDYGSKREVHSACGGFLFLHRRAVDAVGPLDEQFFVYYEETDWMERARLAGFRTVYTPLVHVVHTSGGSTDQGADTLNLLLVESQQKYLAKHFGCVAEFLVRWVLVSYLSVRAALRGARTESDRQLGVADRSVVDVLRGRRRERPLS